jgi:hypothetical protein
MRNLEHTKKRRSKKSYQIRYCKVSYTTKIEDREIQKKRYTDFKIINVNNVNRKEVHAQCESERSARPTDPKLKKEVHTSLIQN